MNTKEELRLYIENECIFRADPNIRYSPQLRPGKILSKDPASLKGSTYQFYLRRLAFNPKMLETACYLLSRRINRALGEYNGRRSPFQIAGLETAATPFIIGLQSAYLQYYDKEINAFSVRPERKTYGIYNLVEGKPNSLPVVVIDDLFNSGSSMHRCMEFCIRSLELELAPTVGAIVALHTNRDAKSFRFRPSGLEIKPSYLFTKEDFTFEYNANKYWLPIDCWP